MRHRIRRTIALAAIGATGILLVGASGAAANAIANYNFTLDRLIVSGKTNGIVHKLDHGVITNSGEIWVTSTDPGANAAPVAVRISVYRERWITDAPVCDVLVTPAPGGQRVPYGQFCGEHNKDEYYIVVSKPVDDGWNLAGAGKLVSTNCAEVKQDVNGTPVAFAQCV